MLQINKRSNQMYVNLKTRAFNKHFTSFHPSVRVIFYHFIDYFSIHVHFHHLNFIIIIIIIIILFVKRLSEQGYIVLHTVYENKTIINNNSTIFKKKSSKNRTKGTKT